jgi:hypothetical protein
MYANLDVRIINLDKYGQCIPIIKLRLESFTMWVGLGITFSIYVWFHIVSYKSNAPHQNTFMYWERFVQKIHFVAQLNPAVSQQSNCTFYCLKSSHWAQISFPSRVTKWVVKKLCKMWPNKILFKCDICLLTVEKVAKIWAVSVIFKKQCPKEKASNI